MPDEGEFDEIYEQQVDLAEWTLQQLFDAGRIDNYRTRLLKTRVDDAAYKGSSYEKS